MFIVYNDGELKMRVCCVEDAVSSINTFTITNATALLAYLHECRDIAMPWWRRVLCQRSEAVAVLELGPELTLMCDSDVFRISFRGVDTRVTVKILDWERGVDDAITVMTTHVRGRP